MSRQLGDTFQKNNKMSTTTKPTTIYFVIENEGEVDPQAFTLLGASTKRTQNDKIGFFGSGNKYSIALLMRKNIFFKIFSGTKEVAFGKELSKFKDQQYEIITVNGEKTSLTTEMGPQWQTWFAIREFYANAVDEGGAKFRVADKIEPVAGTTQIYVEKTPELSDFFANIEKYILTTNRHFVSKTETEFGDVSAITPMDDTFVCYRKGIRVHTQQKKPLFWYNFDDIKINESRVAMYSHEVTERIAAFFACTNDMSLIEKFVNNHKDTYESECASWQYVSRPLSKQWHTLLHKRRIYPRSLAILSGDAELKANSVILPDKLAEKISKEIPTAVVIGYGSNNKCDIVEMTAKEKKLIQTANKRLQEIGYDITCTVAVAHFMCSDTLGQWNKKNNQIILARKYLQTISEDNDMKDLMATILEEHFHSKGAIDGQRAFVTLLLKELIDAKKKTNSA